MEAVLRDRSSLSRAQPAAKTLRAPFLGRCQWQILRGFRDCMSAITSCSYPGFVSRPPLDRLPYDFAYAHLGVMTVSGAKS